MIGVALVAGLNPTSHDTSYDSRAPPVFSSSEEELRISADRDQCQDLVRFFALRRIKPHTPPLVRAPVNSFEF